jgi:hypothetical protein
VNRRTSLRHEFVECIPDSLADGTIYVSTSYATAAHKCCCGCGSEVITPISPTDWQLTFDGETISLHPSIGNWSFECRSHYWIRRNTVQWAPQWSQRQIERGRNIDRLAKERYFSGGPDDIMAAAEDRKEKNVSKKGQRGKPRKPKRPR